MQVNLRAYINELTQQEFDDLRANVLAKAADMMDNLREGSQGAHSASEMVATSQGEAWLSFAYAGGNQMVAEITAQDVE